MFTQCPECRKTYSVSTEGLRTTRGMMKCEQCAVIFDALESLCDELPAVNPDTLASELFPETKQSPKNSKIWPYAFCAGLTTLIGQFFYFEGYALTQNQSIRPWLIATCEKLGCNLPDYKNAGEISILKTTLKSGEQQAYRFQAVIANQSEFSQPYPHIRLTLLDFTGEAMAERVFSPADYQPESNMIAGDGSAEIMLEIAAPDKKFGGYSFKLL